MNILMVTSETVPFSKSGGLADVVGALSKALAEIGNEVRVMMPLYSFIDRKGFRKTAEVTVEMLGKNENAIILEKKLNGVVYSAVAHPYFSDRKGIYGDDSFSPYEDNCPRFIFFSKCVAEYIKKLDSEPDIVHMHDWTAGFIPYYLKRAKIRSKTVFTVHNLAYQGIFSIYDEVLAGDAVSENALSGYGDEKRINMMKAGLLSADAITTVSPTYSEEIKTEEFGCGLDDILTRREKDLYGIINGIDYREWNPGKDRFFSSHYSSYNLSGKEELKKEVMNEYGLIQYLDKPLFAIISRLAEQKGFTELLLDGDESALESILKKKDSSFIVIGTGDDRYSDKLRMLDEKYDNISVNIIFSNAASHRIEGAADFFLMPSRYEPCGLNQIYSEHYGTLPIAHRTGGLADTIIDIDEDGENGTGFLFDGLSSDAIIANAERAIRFYNNDKKNLLRAKRRAMRIDFTWTKSAEDYLGLYKKIK